MMELTRASWNKYVQQLGEIDQRAGQLMVEYIQKVGTADTKKLIQFAAALVNRYGAASSALAARFYDEMAQVSGLTLPAAEPAEVSSYGEVAKAVNGTISSPANTRNAVSRMVKQAGADTILKNAKRDGAEFAWVPNGDSCAFCITLASRGWQKASKAAIKGNHAEHIHANCDCNYCIRFNSKTTVEGYDPDSYLEMYESAEGGTPQEKINAMRRQAYAKKKALEAAGAKKITVNGSTGAGKRDKISAKTDYSHAEFTGTKPLSWHWAKHGSEFPGWTSEQYLARARELLSMKLVDGELEQVTRSDGSVSRYCYSENEFVATTNDGNIRTFFKPKQGREYWDEEHGRN